MTVYKKNGNCWSNYTVNAFLVECRSSKIKKKDKQCPDLGCLSGCPIYQKQHIELLANKKNKL